MILYCCILMFCLFVSDLVVLLGIILKVKIMVLVVFVNVIFVIVILFISVWWMLIWILGWLSLLSFLWIVLIDFCVLVCKMRLRVVIFFFVLIRLFDFNCDWKFLNEIFFEIGVSDLLCVVWSLFLVIFCVLVILFSMMKWLFVVGGELNLVKLIGIDGLVLLMVELCCKVLYIVLICLWVVL